MNIKDAVTHLIDNQHSKTGVVPLGDCPHFIESHDSAHQLAYKKQLFERFGERLFSCPDEHAEAYQAVAEEFGYTDFKTLCLSVAEDLLLILPKGDQLILSGGGLFFPSKWALEDKQGLPLSQVHGPVPHYADVLSNSVDRLLARITEGQLLLRYNWTLHDSDELCQHPDLALFDKARVAPYKLIFRSERQVLSRVNGANAVLFTIKTLQAPLRDIVKSEPKLATFLVEEINAMDDATIAYKSLDGRADEICAFLMRPF